MSAVFSRPARIFALIFMSLLVLLVLAVAGLWWWAGTQHALDVALKQAARYQSLVIEGARGSLRSGVTAGRMQWDQNGLKIELRDVELAWNPLSLLEGTLQLTRLRAASITVQDRRPSSATQPSAAPDSLALPVKAAIDELAVGHLRWDGLTAIEASGLAARFGFDGSRHWLRLESVQFAQGNYQGDVSVGARGKLPVRASLRGRLQADVPGSPNQVPLALNATLQGPLEDMQVGLLLQSSLASATQTEATQATVTARLMPWSSQPVAQAQADFRQLDLSLLWPQAPRSRLSGRLAVQPADGGTWLLQADVSNGLAGPWDRALLPVGRITGSGQWDQQAGAVTVRELLVQLGRGTFDVKGQWRRDGNWALAGVLAGINPALVHSQLAPLPLSGSVEVSGASGAIDFEVAMRSVSRAAALREQGTQLTAALRALELREVAARGRWSDGLLSLANAQLRTSDALLQAALNVWPARRTASGSISLKAPGLQASAQGEAAELKGGGHLNVKIDEVAQALQWSRRVPGVAAVLGTVRAAGRGQADLNWQGGWRDPAVQAALKVASLQLYGATPQLPLTGAQSELPVAAIHDGEITVDGRLSAARVQVRAQAQAGARRARVEVSATAAHSGGPATAGWQGAVSALRLDVADASVSAGTWSLALERPFDWRWTQDASFFAGASRATLTPPSLRSGADTTVQPLTPAVLSWEPLRWQTGELLTAGTLSGLPLAWIELFSGPQIAGAAVAGDMVFDAQWDAQLGQTLRLNASLVRTRGDITVKAETAQGLSTPVRAGIRDARLMITSAGEALNLSLRWDSERAGTVQGRLATRLSRGGPAGWQWAADAPISGDVKAQLPRVGVWSLLAPPGWRLRGSLEAGLAIAGTRADPQLTGSLNADDMALRSVVDGVELQGGRLRSTLEGRRLVVQELILTGAGPAATGGRIKAAGEGSWVDGKPVLRMTAQVERLRASIRDDRQLTVSGSLEARLDGAGTRINGQLKVDQASLVLPDEEAPRLGSDVVVRGASSPAGLPQAAAPAPAAPGVTPFFMVVAIDLGDDFRVRGRGIDTRLGGTLSLEGQSIAAPRLSGVINTAGGEYRAYGQRLDIERGVLRFTGALDNPALDVLAIRPNQIQRVGVQISGRAQAPYVRLYAEPDLPEVEKLSWLVLGRPAANGGAEAALLQQAAVALLASRTGGASGGLASTLGLDELSFRRGDGNEGAAVTLGKRFARNFYAAYERSLSGALGTLFVFYDLSRRVTVRAEAGERTAVDLIFTLSFD